MRVSRHNAVNEVQMQRESNPYSWRDTQFITMQAPMKKAPTEICECFYRLIGFRELFLLYLITIFVVTIEFTPPRTFDEDSNRHNSSKHH